MGAGADIGGEGSSCRVGRKRRIERPEANDRLLPTPHQTGRAVFPHPAFRVPFLGGAMS
jgi:hypothetical protein